jgi:hypothetical protein
MNNTELMVPDQSPEETAVVERFISTSREIVPSVQISLAKRILHPGSNRVVCLAAHTSVPLRDDEMASVSDLALHLSDGTNVRLSLSFFNDGTAAIGGGAAPLSYTPYMRTVYNPEWYSDHNRSRFPVILVCTIVLCAAGAYWAYQRATEAAASQMSTKFSQPLAQTFKKAVKPSIAHAVPAVHPHAAAPIAAAIPLVEPFTSIVHHFKHVAKTSAHEVRHATPANEYAMPRKGMFVPPPPPMEVVLPPGQMPTFQWPLMPIQANDSRTPAKAAAPPATQQQSFDVQKASSKSTASAKPTADQLKQTASAKSTAETSKPPVSQKPASESFKSAVSQKPINEPAKSTVSAKPVNSVASAVPQKSAEPVTKPSVVAGPKVETPFAIAPAVENVASYPPSKFRVERFAGSSSTTEAPLPGITEYASPQLERIVPITPND